MRRLACFTLISLLGSVAVACGAAPPETPTVGVESKLPTATVLHVDISSIDAEGYPRVDGSTSAYPLQFMVACHILDVKCSWVEGDFLDRTRRIAPDLTQASDRNLEALFGLVHNGTHGAYMNLIMGSADLILVAREPSEDEIQYAAAWNVDLDVEPIARDAFVFLVHESNPVQNLSPEQLRAIFSGRITNWSQVGGMEAEIHTYQRNPNSGSQELMVKLVMRGESMLEAPDMVLETMMGPINAIREDPLGIGYSVYFYAANMLPDENVRMLAVDGTSPSSSTIAEASYPLSTEVHAVVRENLSPTSQALRLRDWLHTPEGQRAVEASGYVRFRP